MFVKVSVKNINTKNVCSKQTRNCLLVYSVTFVIWNMCVQIKREGLLLSLFGYFCNTKNVCSKQAGGCFLVYLLSICIIPLKYIYYGFYNNFCEGCFLNGCSLVYLANYYDCFLVYQLLISIILLKLIKMSSKNAL